MRTTIRALAVLVLAAPPGAATPLPPVDVPLVICQAAREQARIEYRWRMYEYHREDVVETMDEGRVVARNATTRYIHRQRPEGIGINETVAIDGTPPGPAERERQKNKVAARRAQLAVPSLLREAVHRSLEESADKASTMAAMTEAFDLRLEGIDWVDGEPAYVVSFRPRANFRPATREQDTFQKMQGVAWVRVTRPVFLRVEADFVENASIKFGPFATITKGSHFLLQQQDVEPGVPMARSLDLDLRLRLFFVVRRSERRGTYYRDFQRVNPPRPLPEP